MLKIAFVLSRVDCNNGVASHIELLASEIIARGMSLTIISGVVKDQAVASDRYDALERLCDKWHVLGDFDLRCDKRSLQKLVPIIRSGNFDLIHVHGLGTLSLAKLAMVGLKVPVVGTYHPSAHSDNAEDIKFSLSLKERMSYKIFLKLFRPDKLIALSSESYDLFTQVCGVPKRRVAKIICGIDTDYFHPPSHDERQAAKSLLKVLGCDLVLVLAGRLNLNKGHDLAITAVDKLRRLDPTLRIKCLFVGAGPQRHIIESMVSKSSDPTMFSMVGYLPDLRMAYWAADVVILPSRNEGFASTVAEAMACACAAVRTPSGGALDQVIIGKTGYIVNFNDPDDLADRIKCLTHPRTLNVMRSNAASHAQASFSAKRMVAETIDLYYGLARK